MKGKRTERKRWNSIRMNEQKGRKKLLEKEKVQKKKRKSG